MRNQRLPIVVMLCCCVALAACGRKPSLRGLEAPEPKQETTTSAILPNDTIDGQVDAQESIEAEAPKRGFLLDFLL